MRWLKSHGQTQAYRLGLIYLPRHLLFKFLERQPLREYVIERDSQAFVDFPNNFKRLNVVVLTVAPPNRDQLVQAVNRVTNGGVPCTARSREFSNFKSADPEYDRALAQATKPAPSDFADEDTTPVSAPVNVLLLLTLNKFGPFVIIFFFSSMLITLYKYNSRLIAFYYARLYAIGSLDGSHNR